MYDISEMKVSLRLEHAKDQRTSEILVKAWEPRVHFISVRVLCTRS